MKDQKATSPFLIFALSSFVVTVLFWWQGNKGFSLWDEGFLWYGVQHVMLGEVPVRDFMSYDPGRYYWSAMLMNLWGDNGIMALRLSVALFQALGLFVGVWLIGISQKKRDWLYLFGVSVLLVLWMYPRHKLFDVSLSIFLVGILTFLISKPTSKRYFLTGIGVGLVAVFGRNHGVYGVVGSLGVLVWLSLESLKDVGLGKALLLWSAGVVIGYTPIVCMILFVPGFAAAFWESIRFLFEIRATNLPLPIPWPWRVDISLLVLPDAVRSILIGLFFIALPAFVVLFISFVISRRLRGKTVPSVLVAATFLSLPYAHYAFSRADVPHLAQGIFPMLLGLLVVFSRQKAEVKWPLFLVLGGASFWVMLVVQPGWQCYKDTHCQHIEISGRSLVVDSNTYRDVSLLRRLAEQFAPPGTSFLVTPFWPGAYALLERRSPMWDIYALFPRGEAFERAEIEQIREANPGFALVVDMALDGHDALRFKNTHPLVNRYITDNFRKIPLNGNPMYHLYLPQKDAQ